MTVFILFLVIVFMLLFVPLRVALLHPFKTAWYAVRDSYFYIAHKEYNRYDGGILSCLMAHFGGGKTLSGVYYVIKLFKRYNNKKVWCRDRKKFVLQKIHIISNVHLNGIPYEELRDLSQIVCCAWNNKEIDRDNDTRTVVIVLLDEASSQLNSRNFKTNIDADFLNTLITSRHFHMSLYYTSQKFKLVDALLRSVTQTCILCKKSWRFMSNTYYDADEIELATDASLVKPIRRKGFFIADKLYNAYDTLATVEKLKKSVDANEMLSASEILELRGTINPDNDGIVNGTRKLRKLRKRK